MSAEVSVSRPGTASQMLAEVLCHRTYGEGGVFVPEHPGNWPPHGGKRCSCPGQLGPAAGDFFWD